MSAAFELRDAGGEDLPFLFELYCDVRGPEVNAWGWPAAQCDAFLRMQFEAQRQSYLAAYPDAIHHIVHSNGIDVGRRLVAATPEEMRLVDIALLSTYRNRGIGAQLIQQLMDDCDGAGCVLRLQVLRGNPAQRLYERLGFRETSTETGAAAMYIEMARAPEPGRIA
jgi:ribosomal protein S18 acetylase RimI-like enzyme